MAKIEIEEAELFALTELLERTLADLVEKETDLQAKTAEFDVLYDSVIRVLEVVGLSDGKKVDPSLYNSGGAPMAKILAAGGSLFLKLGQAGVPGIGRSAKKEIEEKFSFLEQLRPLLRKYEQHNLQIESENKHQ